MLLNPSVDGKNYIHINNPRSKNVVQNIMNLYDLHDVWREENADTCKYTWRRKLTNGKLQLCRLDFF